MTHIDRYAVYGNPIKHSKSPQIHAAFAEQTDQELTYRSRLVEVGRFAETAKSFFENDGKGLNVTVPFKLDACEFADQLSSRARRAGAVNTLAIQNDGVVYGDNTDGIGLVRDINNNLGWEIGGKNILILGAGGAVRGVLEPLLRKKPATLVIANRTLTKAETLADDFSDLGELSACPFESLGSSPFDLVINATSSSLAGELPPLPSNLLTDDACVYDMMYGAEPTPFMRWGAENTAWAVADGLGMLVEQAAESFCMWRGVRPKTKPVIDLLRNMLS